MTSAPTPGRPIQWPRCTKLRDAAHLRPWETGKLAANRSSPTAPAMLHEMAAVRASRDGNSNGESDPPLAWGVDGCPAGWFYIALDAIGEWCCGRVNSLREW